MTCNCQGSAPTRKRGFRLVDYSPSSSSDSSPALSPSPQIGEGNSDLSKYIKKLDEDTALNEKFNFVKARSKYMIENLPDNPEELLHQLFEKAIDDSITEAKSELKVNANMVGAEITSVLLDSPIWLPLREITSNTAEVLLNKFLHVAQSKTDPSLYGEPFTIIVTASDSFAAMDVTNKKRKLEGGMRKKNNIYGVRHFFNNNARIKYINPTDRYCLFYALQATKVRALKEMDKRKLYKYLNAQGRRTLQKDVEQLLQELQIPLDLPLYNAEDWVPKILDHWHEQLGAEIRLKVFIFGTIGIYKPNCKYGPDNFTHPICLIHENKHFEAVKTAASVFGRDSYCFTCEVAFDNVRDHRRSCKSLCLNCGRHGHKYGITNQFCPTDEGFKEECERCFKTFTSRECHQHHLNRNYCRNSAKCGECGVIYDRDNGIHVCGHRHCPQCQRYHHKDSGCFIPPLKPRKQAPFRIVVYDLETTQNESLSALEPKKKKHVPNFIAAMIFCNTCIAQGKCRNSLLNEPCPICGPNRTITFSHQPYYNTKVDKQVVTENPIKAFTKWILYELNKKYTTMAWAHNAGRFDAIMAFSEIYKLGINPTLTKRGNKLYQMVVSKTKQNGEVIFHDSINLMPLPLASLPAAFGLDITDKQFFPYLANRRDNYGKIMKGLPPKSEYLYGGMAPAKKKKFDSWYEVNKDHQFLLDEELPIYCLNDVQILSAALIAFQREFSEISRRPAVAAQPELGIEAKEGHSGIDVLRDSCTISSACMDHFQLNHLKPGKIGIVPHLGYDTANNQSEVALKFLNWYSKKHNVEVQTAHSKEGEHKIGRYSVDGWAEAQKLAIEVNGCVFHACPKCYPEDQQVLPCGRKIGKMMERTAGKIREIDASRLEFIRGHVNEVKVYYQCEIEKMLKSDPEMKRCFDEYLDDSPIRIRNTFMGGRTGAFKVFHQAKPGHKIAYFDVTSMYPHTNHTVPYPLGHPVVTVPNKDVNWQCAEDNPYKLAIMKVFIVPPRQIDVTCFPAKFDERLLFPQCKKCALKYPCGGVIDDYACPHHTDRQRGWVSECTSMELDVALENGYRVTKLFRVLEYAESDADLFKGYIAEFMAMKIHASGFPANIKGSAEKEENYIKECWDMFGIKIDKHKMAANPAKRQLAKLCLNNLWGRFSLRNGLSQVEVIDSPARFCELLNDRKIDVLSVDELNKEQIMVTFQEKEEFVIEHEKSSVTISIWTTSHSRIHLFKLMQKVCAIPGAELIYSDTDSLVFSFPCHCGSDEHNCPCNPLQLGPHLGQLTDEWPDHDIVEVVFAGCKNYALKLHRRGAAPDDFEYQIKVRGLTLNWDVTERQGFRYEVFKEMALNYAKTGIMEEKLIHYPNVIRPSLRTGTVVSQPMDKIYRPYIGKGIITNDFHVREFGYVPPQ